MFSFLRISAPTCSFPRKVSLSIIGNVRSIYRAPGPKIDIGRRPYRIPTRVPPVLQVADECVVLRRTSAGERESPRRYLHPKPPSHKKFPNSRWSEDATCGDRVFSARPSLGPCL
ncbi:hypothetical protein RHMOL_Rhmol10G0193600 [Rhododendron molle]|uniref:Uncharacterized protein n=1 Tax=Rhododendron molle TaxID=49168 RepID=A0ACC0M587_RHOML|nr:hypothetical protein RHMOL_Rhmol10G0193600 [Rhododendron molle]